MCNVYISNCFHEQALENYRKASAPEQSVDLEQVTNTLHRMKLNSTKLTCIWLVN